MILLFMDSQTQEIVELEVPVSRPGVGAVREVHLAPVAMRTASRDEVVEAAIDEYNGISYLSHAGRLYRSLPVIDFNHGWLVGPRREPMAVDALRDTASAVRGIRGRGPVSPALVPGFQQAHRLFSELRSMQGAQPKHYSIRAIPPPADRSPESAAARRIAGGILIVDGMLHISSNGPDGIVFHDQGRHPILSLVHPDRIPGELAQGRSRFPAHLPLLSNRTGDMVHRRHADRLHVPRADLLRPEMALALETERMGWAVLSRLHEIGPTHLRRRVVADYLALRTRLRHGLEADGIRSMPLSRYPHPHDRTEVRMDPDLRNLVLRLEGAYAGTLSPRSGIDELDRLAWFDISPAVPEKEQRAEELADFVGF